MYLSICFILLFYPYSIHIHLLFPGATETDSQCSGVIYITENLIRKMSKEDNFHRIFKLGFTFANDLKKKIKVFCYQLLSPCGHDVSRDSEKIETSC